MGLPGSIVGRESELEFLISHLSSALSGSGSMVLIAGEAGSGKTTLCEAFEQLAVKSGCLVLVGRSVPGPRMPYLPFMEALQNVQSDPFADMSIANEGSRLLLSVLERIERLSEERPLVLRIEDLQWSDSASIALLHFLARNIPKAKVLILGTYRPEDLHPNSAGEEHPLRATLRVMRREALCRELELRPLAFEDTMRIVPLLLGRPAEDRLQDHVANESRGNPLFAVEIIKYLAVSEQIYQDQGVWKLRLKEGMQIPTTIREVVLARVERLPREARTVLEIASVIGELFGAEVIEAINKVDMVHLCEVLEVMDREYRLIVCEEGRYRFYHDKVRQVIYDEISHSRRKEMHRLIGLHLESGLPNDELLGPLSWHFLEAGEKKKGVTYAMASGRLCYRRKAVREAKSMFLAVLQRTESDASFLREHLEALESLGDLKNHASGPREWYSYYERFIRLSEDRPARARVMAKAAECWDQLGLNDARKAYRLLDEAEDIADHDIQALAEITYRRADLISNEGRNEEALALIRQARQDFELLGDLSGVSKCIELEVITLRQALRFTEARKLAEAQLQAVRTMEDPEPLLWAEMLAGFVCGVIGDIQATKGYATEAIELSYKLGLMWTYRLALLCRATARELEGDVEGAIDDLSKALENAREYESPFHAALFEIDLGRYEAELGHLESANQHYEGAVQMVATFDPYLRSLLDLEISVLWAELLWRSGRGEESEGTYLRAIAFAEESKDPYEAVKCKTRFAMSLVRRGRRDEGRELFQQAMAQAVILGCQPRVVALAKRVGLSL